MADMEGKDKTLLEAVREQEKAVGLLMQTLGLSKPQPTDATPYAPPSTPASQKIQDAIQRLEVTRRGVVEATGLVGGLIKVIGK